MLLSPLVDGLFYGLDGCFFFVLDMYVFFGWEWHLRFCLNLRKFIRTNTGVLFLTGWIGSAKSACKTKSC